MIGYEQIKLLDNSPAGLVDSIAERVRNTLDKSWWYQSEHSEEYRTPHVHSQYLPIRNVSDEENDESRQFPIIQVFHAQGEIKANTFDEATQKIIIAFGGWDLSITAQGWRIPTAMMWAVLQNLVAHPFIGSFEMTAPIEWSLPKLSEDEHPPYFTATLTTTWKCGNIMFEPVDKSVYPDNS